MFFMRTEKALRYLELNLDTAYLLGPFSSSIASAMKIAYGLSFTILHLATVLTSPAADLGTRHSSEARLDHFLIIPFGGFGFLQKLWRWDGRMASYSGLYCQYYDLGWTI